MLKDFITSQKTFNKSVEEKLGKLDILSAKVIILFMILISLKLVFPIDIKEHKSLNAIQIKIVHNIRMLPKLHARWEREEKEAEIAETSKVANVCTIFTDDDIKIQNAHGSPTGPKYANGKQIGVRKIAIAPIKNQNLSNSSKTVSKRSAKINPDDNDPFRDDAPVIFYDNDLDFDNCNLIEVIKFVQNLAKNPIASKMNMAFTHHITNALVKVREEKIKSEFSVPRKLEDAWEPTIKMKVNDFECNAMCDLGASVSIMPKMLYDILDLEPLEDCPLNVYYLDYTLNKPMEKIDDVLIMFNGNHVPIDFIIMDIECKLSCPIVLGRPFLRTICAIIYMKEGNIKYQFPLKRYGTLPQEDNEATF